MIFAVFDVLLHVPLTFAVIFYIYIEHITGVKPKADGDYVGRRRPRQGPYS